MELPLRNVSASEWSVSPETVTELVRQVTETTGEIGQVRRSIRETETGLTNSQHEVWEAPATIERLADELARLDKQLVAARRDHAAASARLTGFMSTITDGRKELRRISAASTGQQFNDAVARIKNDRRKRDEIRKRLGARASHLDEAILEDGETRRAKAIAEENYARQIAHGDATIDAKRALLQDATNDLRSHIAQLEADQHRTAEQLREERQRLLSAPSRIAAHSKELVHLKQQLDKLSKRKSQLGLALAEARAALQRQYDVQLARERAHQREIELASRNQDVKVASFPSVSPATLSFPASVSRVSRRYYDPTYRPLVGDHYVRPHIRRDGTVVAGHRRTNADDSFFNNWSARGSANPFTGRAGNKLPPLSNSGGGTSYVRGHYRSNGTYVNGYSRRSR